MGQMPVERQGESSRAPGSEELASEAQVLGARLHSWPGSPHSCGQLHSSDNKAAGGEGSSHPPLAIPGFTGRTYQPPGQGCDD